MSICASWGILYNSAMYHAWNYQCECQIGKVGPDFFKLDSMLVGFDTGISVKSDDVGVGIFQCDKCFEYFWLHINYEMAKFFRRSAPQWPK
jgi:hypothetical protein